MLKTEMKMNLLSPKNVKNFEIGNQKPSCKHCFSVIIHNFNVFSFEL